MLVSLFVWLLLRSLSSSSSPSPCWSLCFQHCHAVSGNQCVRNSLLRSAHGCLFLCLLLELAEVVMVERVAAREESGIIIPAWASRMSAAGTEPLTRGWHVKYSPGRLLLTWFFLLGATVRECSPWRSLKYLLLLWTNTIIFSFSHLLFWAGVTSLLSFT